MSLVVEVYQSKVTFRRLFHIERSKPASKVFLISHFRSGLLFEVTAKVVVLVPFTEVTPFGSIKASEL